MAGECGVNRKEVLRACHRRSELTAVIGEGDSIQRIVSRHLVMVTIGENVEADMLNICSMTGPNKDS